MSLRELYERTSKYHSYNPALYDVLKALVEAVEPEDTNTTIRKLRKRLENVIRDGLALVQQVREERDEAEAELEAQRLPDTCTGMLMDERDSWEQQCRNADRELAKANRRYDESRAAWARLEASLREQISEATVEIERLHTRKAWWEHSVKSWKAEEISWREEMDELRAELESLKANADLGKMLRGMRPGSRLIRVALAEDATEWWIGTGSDAAHAIGDDPAEALRAIQEVGDGEA